MLPRLPLASAALLLSLALVAACDLTITNNSNGSGTGGNGGAGGTGSPTSPTPGTPTPGTPTPGFRTPDPAPGSFLPLPSYGAQVVQSVTTPLGDPCTTFTYLDAVVDALRLHDTRWGYVCGSDCVNTRRDKIAYHATAGPDVSGALGVWMVDVIGSACAPDQHPAYFVIGFDPTIGWSSRGRF